jgi:hypothetical protein
METPTKLPRNKPMLIASFSFIILFILFAVADSRLPDAGGGWHNPPIYDYVFILGFGICWSVLCIGYTYYAWTLNANDFEEWVKNQVFMPKKQRQKPVSDFARAYNQWFFRFITPVGALFGIAMIGFMVFAIITYLLK